MLTHLNFPHWGGKSISDHLLNQEIAYVCAGTAQKIKNKFQKVLNEANPNLEIITRYEALNPNELWATDIFQFDWYGDTLYIPVLIDDSSRFVISWMISFSPTTDLVLNMIEEATIEHQVPVAIKSDNGPQFRKSFAKGLNLLGIEHINSPCFRPSYNGKVERLIKDIKYAVSTNKELNSNLKNLVQAIRGKVYEHNFIKPQQSLGGITPYDRFSGKEQLVKTRRFDFKQKELARRGFNCQRANNINNSRGIVVPIQRDGKKVLDVKIAFEIKS